MVPVVPSTDYIGIFHTKWSIVASETGLSEVEVGLSATIGPTGMETCRGPGPSRGLFFILARDVGEIHFHE